jgi:hypothetical protein
MRFVGRAGRRVAAASVCALCLRVLAAIAAGQNTELVPRISQHIPSDFFSSAIGTNRDLARLQKDFDIYSWETFIALNWPSNGNDIGAEADSSTMWEDWRSVLTVFLSDGKEPEPWEAKQPLEQMLPGVDTAWLADQRGKPLRRVPNLPGLNPMTLQEAYNDPGIRNLTKMAKGHAWFSTEQPFDTGPLIDQAGQYCRFEVLMNREMFGYIVRNKLFHEAGQEAFFRDHSHVVFPFGRFKRGSDGSPVLDGDNRPVGKETGAIVIKAAWKPLSAEEVRGGRFHMRDTLVYTPNDSKNGITGADVTLVKMGLVGIHIVHKSEDVAQWTWSTFEHVDNCPEYGDRVKKGHYSFYSPARYDPKSTDSDSGLNRPPARPWDPKVTEPPSRRSQIVRMLPLSQETRALNEKFQDLLRTKRRDTVWQYYQLISTQWPTRPAGIERKPEDKNGDVLDMSPTDLLGGPAPVFLGNSTLESYIQGTTPNVSSSCMDCHANATTKGGPGARVQFADFTFVLDRAKPQANQ